MRRVREAAAQERAGRWEESLAGYEAVFHDALRSGWAGMMVDATRWQARVRGQQRKYDEAEELAELSGAIAEAHGLAQGQARALNLIATLRHERGDLDSAFPLYEAALVQARHTGDDLLIGFICQNLGVHANMRGDLRGARVLYLESIAATLASGDETNAAMAYNNLGMVCTDLEEWLEAEVYFDRGIEVARRLGDRAHLARLYANRAEPLLLTGETARARASLAEAARLAEEVGARGTLGTVARFEAMACRLEGEYPAAEAHLRRALEIAWEGGMLLGEAEAQEELARLRLAQGRVAEAVGEAAVAQALFRELGAARDVARLTLLLEELEGRRR